MSLSRHGVVVLTCLFAALCAQPAPAQSCLKWLSALWRKSAPAEFAELIDKKTPTAEAEPAPVDQTTSSPYPDSLAEPVPGMSAKDLKLVLDTYWHLFDELPGGNDPAVLRGFVEAKDPFAAQDEGALGRKLLQFSKLLESRKWKSPQTSDRLLGVVNHRLGALGVAERKLRLAELRLVPYELSLTIPTKPTWLENGRLRFAWRRTSESVVDVQIHDLEERALSSRPIDASKISPPRGVWVTPNQQWVWMVSANGEISRASLADAEPRAEKVTLTGPAFPPTGVVLSEHFTPDGALALLQVGVPNSRGTIGDIAIWLIDTKAKTRSKLKLADVADYNMMGIRPGEPPQFYVGGQRGLNVYPIVPTAGKTSRTPVEVIPTPEGRRAMWSADGKHYGYHRFEQLYHSAWRQPLFFDANKVMTNNMGTGAVDAIAIHPIKPQFAVLRQRDPLSGIQYVDWMGETGRLSRIEAAKDGEPSFDKTTITTDGTQLILESQSRIRIVPIND